VRGHILQGAPTDGTERKLLLACARHFLGTAQDAEALELIRRPLNWQRLFRNAEREGMSGLLHSEIQHLAQRHDLDLPYATRARALHHNFARNGAYLTELSMLREALGARGLQVIVLKGAALIERVYGGHLGLRPLSDVDLLIKASDLPFIDQALRQRGFHPDSPSSMFYTNGPLAFDLHTSLINEERVRRKGLAFSFDAEAIWQEASPLSDRDSTLLVLAAPPQFLHVVIHALKHSFSRLMWLVDLGLIARRVEWPELVDRARAAAALRPLAYGVCLLEALLRVDVAPSIRAALPKLNRIERLFVSSVVRRSSTETFGDLTVAFSIPGTTGKLSYLAELCFPRRAVLGRHYPDTRPWLRHPRRVLRLLTLGFREIGRIARVSA
jgi:hypothetical protein